MTVQSKNLPGTTVQRCLLAAVVLLTTLTGPLGAAPAASAATDEWPMYLHDTTRTSASADTTFSSANAANISPLWNTATGGVIAASASVVNGTAYVGSWDGYEYALDAATGAVKWKASLGITTANPTCIPPKAGVSSTATVVGSVVYVGGGDSNWYALNASTGAVLWSVPTGDNSAAGGHYNWSSPLIYNGFAYIGIASMGDCPLVQGELLKVSLSTHQVVATAKMVPDGQVGGGIWTTPAVDAATNRVFVSTGTENAVTQTDAQAILALDANSLAVVDQWKLPESQAVADSDFSTSTAFFTDSHGTAMLSAVNKNGNVYAFNRNNLAAGPVWQRNIAVGGECPTCGQSSVSSGAFGQGKLFYGGETTTINGTGYQGSVRALDPTSGAVIWEHPTTGPVIGHLTYANGLVFSSSGSVFEALDAATGNRLYSYDFGIGLYSGPTVAEGRVYVGTLSGKEYAFALGSPITPPADPNCPANWTCQDINGATPAGTESVSGTTWSLSGGGAGLAGTADSFRLSTTTQSGNAQVAVRVPSLPGSPAGLAAGVILRQNNTAGSPYYAALMKPGGGLAVEYRSGFGAGTNILTASNPPGVPTYLEIQRLGDTLSAATSADGSNWTLVPGTSATVVMPTAVMAGLALTSGAQGTAATANFTNVSVSAPTNSPAPPSSSPCPSSWTCGDVGNPALAGDQTLSGNTWAVKGAGGDIWNTSDQFRYVSQSVPGDATISARVTGQTNTSDYAKAGVMLRTDRSAGSAYYAFYVTPGHGLAVQYRQSNGFTAAQPVAPAGAVPVYLQVARSGTAFTAYTSSDGTSWQSVPGSTVNLPSMSGTIQAGLAVTAHNTGQLSTATLTNVALANSAPPPPNLCPNGWSCSDVGFATPAGDQVFNNNAWTIDGGGADIWDTSDSFRFISQPLAGDGSLSAHVASQANTNAWAKTGVMARLDSSGGSPYYAVLVTPQNGVVVQYRTSANANPSQIVVSTAAAPVWLKLIRSGTSFTAYTSTDGNSWQAAPGTTVSIPALTGTLNAGMAVCSHDNFNLSQVVFDNVNLGSSTVPPPWADADINGPATTLAGSAQYNNGTFTVKGSGWDIWQQTDEFNYVSQPLNGDGTVTAHITGQTNTDSWAKAGVMIKESAAAGAKYVMLADTPGNGPHFQYNFTGDIAGPATAAPPNWLRLTRAGNVFTAYTSSDGLSWQAVGSTTLAMNANATTGLAVTAHNGNALSTATFDNVSVTAGAGLPSGWANADIGSPSLAGTSTFANNAWSVTGSGWDVWGTADQFQFAYLNHTGDGTITARINSQTNTNPWAKAGLMIRSSAAANQPYAFLAVTPGNGLHLQYNLSGDTADGAFLFPTWLRLTRTGNTISAFTSVNGTTWSPAGQVTLNLGTGAVFGLAVTAHDGNQLSTAAFDNVSVSP